MKDEKKTTAPVEIEELDDDKLDAVSGGSMFDQIVYTPTYDISKDDRGNV